MQPEVHAALTRLVRRESLDEAVMQSALGAIMDGRCDEVEISALLIALAVNGETEEELTGAARAMRARASRIESSRPRLLDTCGTGGDGLHTFNISTATALVTAAAGVPVAKHGNRSVSSSSGSAEVLETLGVNINLSPQQAGRCLDEVGICFCYARTLHSAMKHVGPVRQKLGMRTIFNLLGPLTNPAGAEFQLLGAPRDLYAEKIAGAARRLGTGRALIVCGNDQIDEVALWGHTRFWDVHHGQVTSGQWTAADLGLPECRPEELRVDSPAASATVIRDVLAGKPGPARNMIAANVAAALLCHGDVETLQTGVARAQQDIDSGAAVRKLEKLVRWTTQIAASPG